jgi:NADH-quinone oxidoreductase subunit F
MAKFEPILLRNLEVDGATDIAVYKSRGGYKALAKALKSSAEDVIETVKAANLRGRGGAGFPAGVKWGFLPKDRTVTYLCVNADESEPPTFNNRVLIERDPHQLLEGTLIAGYATGATTAYIYMRGEFIEQFHVLQNAVDQAYSEGILGKNILGSGYSMDCYVHRGAGAYVCGEETGLIESLEGKRGWPRIKPPFPAIEGLFAKPTVVNNVETLSCLPHILERGSEWFKGIGPDGSSGPKLFCVSGPVNRPGCFEDSMDVTVRDLINEDKFSQGMRDGKAVKGVFPGGLSMGVLTADELDMKMNFDAPRKFGLLGLGTAAMVVFNEDTDIRQVLHNVTRFYAMESCGQCTQCREGTSWMYKMAMRIAHGAGRVEDLDVMVEVANRMGMMPGLSICGLPDGAAFPIRTLIEKFRDELVNHINNQEPGRAQQVLRVLN